MWGMASSPNIPPPQGEPGEDGPIIVRGRAATLVIAPAAIEFTFVRSSGPGGQSVNKLNTRAQMRVPLDVIGGLDSATRARLRRIAGQRLVGGGQDGSDAEGFGEELFIQADGQRSQLANKRACIARLVELLERAANPPRRRKRRRVTAAMKRRRLERKRKQSEKKQRRRRDRVDPDQY